jgi:hypothetical protein
MYFIGYFKKFFQNVHGILVCTMELVQSDIWVFWHPVTSDKKVDLWLQSISVIKPEYSDILYNPTHFFGPFVCRIRQVPVDVVEWSRALDVRLSEWCCSVTMVWVQIPSREEQTVLELDFRAVKFLFFPRRDLNPHHWYTAAPFA